MPPILNQRTRCCSETVTWDLAAAVAQDQEQDSVQPEAEATNSSLKDFGDGSHAYDQLLQLGQVRERLEMAEPHT